MRTIETAISVNRDGIAVIELQLPRDVSVGVHRAVVIVDDQTAATEQHIEPILKLLPLTFAGWPTDCMFRREDLYGNNGR
jgi:hypothetical protein